MFNSIRKNGKVICLCAESLEKRATPCGWAEIMEDDFCETGDVNCDGVFDSSDLIMLMQAGKFETREAASWSEGDFNGDGVFDSTDLVLPRKRWITSCNSTNASVHCNRIARRLSDGTSSRTS